MDYPGNSHASRSRAPKPEKEAPKKEEPKKVEKIIEGTAQVRKKPLGKRFLALFGGGDAKGVGQYVIFDVLVPALREMIVDAGQEAIRRLVLGESASGNRRGSRPSGYSGGYTSYGSYSRPSWQRDPREEPRRDVSRRARATHDFGEIVIGTRHEAEEVLDSLDERIDLYGQATVTDLYDLVGISSSFTDEKWGWTNLQGTSVSRTRGGFVLNLPRPETLD